MARVTELFSDQRSSTPHPTQVECGYQVVTATDGIRLLQLSTYGSDGRMSEKKVSQTIQIDKRVAEELVALLTGTFDI